MRKIKVNQNQGGVFNGLFIKQQGRNHRLRPLNSEHSVVQATA